MITYFSEPLLIVNRFFLFFFFDWLLFFILRKIYGFIQLRIHRLSLCTFFAIIFLFIIFSICLLTLIFCGFFVLLYYFCIFLFLRRFWCLFYLFFKINFFKFWGVLKLMNCLRSFDLILIFLIFIFSSLIFFIFIITNSDCFLQIYSFNFLF